ncbi:hypothetical protein BpHYR1_047926 [Brachionus plicatilis]|uniref:Uncharacterized protein n=1 Tax=Brachionus plicatilis TaxID=10195 RepID=A0A3M7RKU3_BRAPC|nr:hypothetical protein BpHYR1_047926 [Brachionus plicatilis]
MAPGVTKLSSSFFFDPKVLAAATASIIMSLWCGEVTARPGISRAKQEIILARSSISCSSWSPERSLRSS